MPAAEPSIYAGLCLGENPHPSTKLLVPGPGIACTYGLFPLFSAFLLLKLGFSVGMVNQSCAALPVQLLPLPHAECI